MALKEQINNDLKAALLGGDRFRAEVIRGLKASVLNEEVASNSREAGLDDDSIQKLIAREVKKRNESASIYEKAARPELAEKEKDEAKILGDYLPTQLSEQEISDVVSETIDRLGANNPSFMGQIIGSVKAELGNSADGAVIARIVKDSLTKK